jgi:hypothetical protein
MTIVRHEGKQQITCDSCPSSHRKVYDAEDFDIMLDDIKADGWRIVLRAGAWTHICSSCVHRKASGALL